MIQIPKDSETKQILSPFLSAPQRPEGTLTYHQLQGFLFTIACSPEIIKPSEWLHLVFNEQQANYDTTENAQSILQSLMDLYNVINNQVVLSEVTLPADININHPAIDNLGQTTPLGQWAMGFLQGHNWLFELWDSYIPDELSDELSGTMMVLSLFSNHKLAQGFYQEIAQTSGQSFDNYAETILDLFPDALISYAHLARSIQKALYEQNQQQPYLNDKKVGRNEACPCGSGKKYKKCCLH